MVELEKKWGYWTANILLILGISFLLTGIVFFFAFNWQNMFPLQKFIAIEIGILAFILIALIYPSSKLYKGLSLTAASVLVGVFLAVFGQIYQTGADAYQLFATWLVLILPWVFIAKFTPLWILWVILVNTTLSLYWMHSEYLPMLLLLVNGFFLAIKEHSVWLHGRWPRILLALFILVIAYLPTKDMLAYIINGSDYMILGRLIDPFSYVNTIYYTGLLSMAFMVGFLYYYSRQVIDLWVVALTTLEMVLLICATIDDTLERLNVNELLSYYSMLILFIVLFSLAAYFLIRLGKSVNTKD